MTSTTEQLISAMRSIEWDANHRCPSCHCTGTTHLEAAWGGHAGWCPYALLGIFTRQDPPAWIDRVSPPGQAVLTEEAFDRAIHPDREERIAVLEAELEAASLTAHLDIEALKHLVRDLRPRCRYVDRKEAETVKARIAAALGEISA
jgi:hypothetical protein